MKQRDLFPLILLLIVGALVVSHREPVRPLPVPSPAPAPRPVKISTPRPSYMDYAGTVAQMKRWCAEAPSLAEFGTYGKTTRGQDCTYIRVGQKRGPVVLVTACIHGNEPLASSTVMWYIGALLDTWGKDAKVTALLESRDFYFVPVLSPDSYPNSRQVDGVDPNRDFPGPSRPAHKSVAPVQAIQDLFAKIKPAAVISGHTFGRVYLTPFGDTATDCPDHAALMGVMNKMTPLSKYRCIRACDMYGMTAAGLKRVEGLGDFTAAPITGSEVDFFYRGGAFAIVCEFGSHQHLPTDADTREEFDRTFPAFMIFADEAPMVKLHPKGVSQ